MWRIPFKKKKTIESARERIELEPYARRMPITETLTSSVLMKLVGRRCGFTVNQLVDWMYMCRKIVAHG